MGTSAAVATKIRQVGNPQASSSLLVWVKIMGSQKVHRDVVNLSQF
jgi:hypothetical protein